MQRAAIVVLALAGLLFVALIGAALFVSGPSESAVVIPDDAPGVHPGLLYGRVTTTGGASFEGRLRFGGDQEAVWADTFSGVKVDDAWAEFVPPEAFSEERELKIFGIELRGRKRAKNRRRPFLARFGDIARIEVEGERITVTMKSGLVQALDRNAADDLSDGLWLWPADGDLQVFDESAIASIELFAAPDGPPTEHLFGTVRIAGDSFTGHLCWERRARLGGDRWTTRDRELPFSEVAAIEWVGRYGVDVTLESGERFESVVRERQFGFAVDDPRIGRVAVDWGRLESVTLRAGVAGPTYDAFPAGRELYGTVTSRDGRSWTGRLVYDLDESESTDTLDAEVDGLNYSILFDRIAAIDLSDDEVAELSLVDGLRLTLDRNGDLGVENAGILLFVEERPHYVPWRSVARIEFQSSVSRR